MRRIKVVSQLSVFVLLNFVNLTFQKTLRQQRQCEMEKTHKRILVTLICSKNSAFKIMMLLFIRQHRSFLIFKAMFDFDVIYLMCFRTYDQFNHTRGLSASSMTQSGKSLNLQINSIRLKFKFVKKQKIFFISKEFFIYETFQRNLFRTQKMFRLNILLLKPQNVCYVFKAFRSFDALIRMILRKNFNMFLTRAIITSLIKQNRQRFSLAATLLRFKPSHRWQINVLSACKAFCIFYLLHFFFAVLFRIFLRTRLLNLYTRPLSSVTVTTKNRQTAIFKSPNRKHFRTTNVKALFLNIIYILKYVTLILQLFILKWLFPS